MSNAFLAQAARVRCIACNLTLLTSEQHCPDCGLSREQLVAMANSHAFSQWEVTAPEAPKLDNPALAGVPGKPRCEQCTSLLADGRCVEPDCPEGPKQPASSQETSTASSAKCIGDSRKRPATDVEQLRDNAEASEVACDYDQGSAHREGDPHPDDAPPDEAIGQQRCDEPPVLAVEEEPAPDNKLQLHFPEALPSTTAGTGSDCSTPRSIAAPSVFSEAFAPDEETLRMRALISLDPKVRPNHVALAKLIALRMDADYAIERMDKENLVLQYFDPSRRIWVRGGGGRHLVELVTETLYQIFPELPEEQKASFGNDNITRPVANLLKNYLPQDRTGAMPALDGNQTRGLLRFACGTVLDLCTGVSRHCKPADRISLCTGYAYSEWSVTREQKDFVAKLCEDLNAAWQEGADANDIPNAAERLKRLVEESTLYRIFYCLFEDHSMALWLLRQSVRAAAGLAGYEEVLFLVDSRSSNGKGTWLAVMKAVLGAEADNGYYATLDYEKHFVGNGMAQKCINSPDMAALNGKRFTAVNESPESTGEGKLNTTIIKKIASWDEPFSAMAKYKDPTSFFPQCLLAFCTNSQPIFPARDGGFSRAG